MKQCISYLVISRVHNSVRREVLYNILLSCYPHETGTAYCYLPYQLQHNLGRETFVLHVSYKEW